MSIPFKSYCWNFGTASFRTKNFNRTIEEQLSLLKEFWEKDEYSTAQWDSNTQTAYYDFIKSKGFVTTEANRKDKDARQKTSGLEQLGLILPNRRLTEAGKALLAINQNNNYTSDNFFQIPKDSYIYMKQLLKTENNIEDDISRPFIIIVCVIAKLKYLTLDEFTYLLPLCTNVHNTKQIFNGIKNLRLKHVTVDQVIQKIIFSMENYQMAQKKFFISKNVTEDLICEIGMNRKSRNLDKNYYSLYCILRDVYIKHDAKKIFDLYNTLKAFGNGKIVTQWKDLLFKNSISTPILKKEPKNCLKRSEFDEIKDEQELKQVFFKYMHLIKVKTNLSDYLDLNKRYIKTSDIIIFEDERVYLDIIPNQFFAERADELFKYAFNSCHKLETNCSLEDIAPCLNTNEDILIKDINAGLGIKVNNLNAAKKALRDKRYERLKHLIDTKFTDEKIIKLLDLFEERKDDEIHKMVTDNADVPTIFEYLLGILWYKISDYEGDILDFMKLSLDAELLPKSHAAGGEADIVYEYKDNKPFYPEHSLLLEATLTDKTNQRRMEMEPVSRHLGQHLLKYPNKESYCVFVTNHLDINVTADFRNRKNSPYYDSNDTTKFVNGMKIIPLQSSELKQLIRQQKSYKELYKIFEKAYKSLLQPHEWYEAEIKQRLIGVEPSNEGNILMVAEEKAIFK